jgi:putative transcriptional regulator
MRKTKPPILAAVHDTAKGLHKACVMDEVALRQFAQLALPPVDLLKPAQIKPIREASHVSHAVFYRLLNTSPSTVQKWEIGKKKPTGTALKLLHLVQQRGLAVVARCEHFRHHSPCIDA